MKHGYYIFPCGYEDNAIDYIGVQKKIIMQCSEFSKHFSIEYVPLYENKPITILGKGIKRLLFHSAKRNYKELLCSLNNPDFIYIRRTTADLELINFLKKIKEQFPSCKIIMEIYTYPYEQDEYKTLLAIPSLLKDRLFRHFYKSVIDRFVTYSNDNEIFGVQTIKTINGVDTNSFTPIQPRGADDEIHLLAIAMFQEHHGYERVISGINQYYIKGGRRNIKLFMVGDGPETLRYKDLVSIYDLDDHVIFYGKRTGEELDAIYDLSDIGLGSFGLYKIGLDTVSSLKSKEYLAKGLPIAAGIYESFVNDKIAPFYLEFSNDSTILDINRIVEFYDAIYTDNNTLSRQSIANNLHNLAEESVSMRSALQPIVDYLLE